MMDPHDPAWTGDSDSDDEVETSWEPVDLTAALLGMEVPAPGVLCRRDGCCLLYSGRVNSFHGETESLKSRAAQVAAAQLFAVGDNVPYVDYEDE